MKVARYTVDGTHGAPPNATALPNLVEGLFCSLNSSGEMILADFRNSQGRPPARGVITQTPTIRDPLGNVLMVQTQNMAPYTQRGRVGGFTGLTPGATYYLSSGGTIQSTTPGTTGDIHQEVGYAESESILILAIGPAVIA